MVIHILWNLHFRSNGFLIRVNVKVRRMVFLLQHKCRCVRACVCAAIFQFVRRYMWVRVTVTLCSHSLHLHNSSCQCASAEGDIFSISLEKQGLSIKCVKWSGMSVGERRASFVPMWRCCARIDSLLFMRLGLSPTNQWLLGVFSPAYLEKKKMLSPEL